MHAARPTSHAPWTAACLLVSAIALGFAVQVRDGLVAPGAIAWLTVALFTTIAAFVRLPATSRLLILATRGLPTVAAIGLAIQLLLHLAYRPPTSWHGGHSTWPYYACLALAAMSAGVMIARPRLARTAFYAAVGSFACLGVWLLVASPRPKMDVWAAQSAGLDAALHGQDPWSSTFADLYGKPDLYAPGTVRDGRTHLGFPYPPVTFWMDLPAHVLAGDYRWSNLAAMLLAAVLISQLRDDQLSRLAALLFLFTPRALLVLRNGWTEPTVVLLLTATVWSMVRRPNWTPWLLGLLLASKQYMFIALAPAWLILPREARGRWCGKVMIAGLVASLPLILWNLRAYVHANFAAASGAAFRYDALSYFAWWADTHDWTPPRHVEWISLATLVPTGAFVLRRAARSAAGFAAALSLVALIFFASNKFAFCNYYYLVIATLCTSVAASAAVEVEAIRLVPPGEPVRRAA